MSLRTLQLAHIEGKMALFHNNVTNNSKNIAILTPVYTATMLNSKPDHLLCHEFVMLLDVMKYSTIKSKIIVKCHLSQIEASYIFFIISQ